MILRVALVVCLFLAAELSAAAVTGRVTDQDTGEPLASVTIRVEGTGHTALTSPDGEYRLALPAGDYTLRFSHVGHYSQNEAIIVADQPLSLDVALRRAFIEVSSVRVFERALDPAQQIIAAAIRRKQEILTQLQRYDFAAYSRWTLRDLEQEDSAQSVMMVEETQVDGYWEYPDSYKEVITARKQTANLEPDDVVAIVPSFNFNENYMDLGAQRIITPTGKDALDNYNYYLLDTILIDDRRVFHLEVEPKNAADPLFVGTVDIADSTFEVTAASLRFTEGVDLPYIKDLLLEQRHARFDDFWMPVELTISARLDPPILGVYELTYRKAIVDYHFAPRHEPGLFDYVYEIQPGADDYDSIRWFAGPVIPLTPLESDGYLYIDSVVSAPKPVTKTMLSGTAKLLGLAFDRNIFRYNRAEGAFVGGHYTWRPRFATALRADLGYAIDAKLFEHRVQGRHRLWQRKRLDVSAEHFHRILGRPTVISKEGYNSTPWALLLKKDPVDYYREEGIRVGAAVSPLSHWRLGVDYHDAHQYSSAIVTDYAVFQKDEPWRINPDITEGQLRSLSAWLRYDSRPLIKTKHAEDRLSTLPQTIIEFEVETADPDIISNDFDYSRYSLHAYRSQGLLGLGVTSLEGYVGFSDRALPIQRLFTMDFGDAQTASRMNFKTLGRFGFSGDRVASVYMHHGFGTRFWKWLGVPLIRDIPFSLGVQGGAFVTDYDDSSNHPTADDPTDAEGHYFHPAQRAYREIGFSLGRIPPVALKLWFNWQLSDYDTHTFRVDWSLLF